MSRQRNKGPSKGRATWSPGMEQRANLEGRQVKCLIASEGHMWMRGYFDRLPSAVRHRLAESVHNLCSACVSEEADRLAKQLHTPRATVAIYLAAIEAIERMLGEEGNNRED
jgi:hypothetical protein